MRIIGNFLISDKFQLYNDTLKAEYNTNVAIDFSNVAYIYQGVDGTGVKIFLASGEYIGAVDENFDLILQHFIKVKSPCQTIKN